MERWRENVKGWMNEENVVEQKVAKTIKKEGIE